jgi:hypothetical protein
MTLRNDRFQNRVIASPLRRIRNDRAPWSLSESRRSRDESKCTLHSFPLGKTLSQKHICIENHATVLMSINPQPHINHWLHFLIACTVTFAGCTREEEKNAGGAVPAPVSFSVAWEACTDLQDMSTVALNQSGDSLELYSSSNGFVRVSFSLDDGRSWSPSREIFHGDIQTTPVILHGNLLGFFQTRIFQTGGQMYFSRVSPGGVMQQSRIRDTDWGGCRSAMFASDADGRLYCTWVDWRKANADIYVASSADTGRTWRRNKCVYNDAAGQEQVSPWIGCDRRGRVYCIWSDNRNAGTLFDIYCAASSDKGASWSPSVRVNDDTTRTFQIDPMPAISADGTVHISWVDYRDKSLIGDHTSGIYFSSSSDGGLTWSKNIPIMRTRRVHNWNPVLTADSKGVLHCVWKSNEVDPTWRIMYAYSNNEGTTWSEPVAVNSGDGNAVDRGPALGIFERRKQEHLMAWQVNDGARIRLFFASRLLQPPAMREPRSSSTGASQNQPIRLFSWKEDRELFEDYFATGKSDRWRTLSGIWLRKDSTLIGYGMAEGMTVAGSGAWKNYSVRSSFRLDHQEHRAGLLYLRFNAEGARPRYYRVMNFFREGVTLAYFDGKAYQTIAFTPYPFRKDCWYRTQTVVKDNCLQHSINDSLVLSSDRLTQIGSGGVGLGAFLYPVYYSKFSVHSIR